MTKGIIPRKMKKREGYRNTLSIDGRLTAHISSVTAERMRNYCSRQNIAMGKFAEDCINAQLDVLEREALNSMPKEMLIELLLAKKN